MWNPIRYLSRRARRLRFAGIRALRETLPPWAIELLKRVREIIRRGRRLRSTTPQARREAALQEVEALAQPPLISLVMPTYKTENRYLREAVDSVLGQYYPGWELCVVDDGSEDPQLCRTLESYAAVDPRIKFQSLPRNLGISAASNAGLAMCSGDFVGFLDHDDALTPDALLRVAQALSADPQTDVVYSDQDKLTAHGARADPFLKPDWSPVYALGAMYIGHLLVVRRSLADAVGGFDPAFDKIQDFEFMLRVSERTDRIRHIPQILYHWRAIPGSIAAEAEEKSGVPEIQARAVTAHLERIGVDAIAVPHPAIPHRAILARRDGGGSERVSIVIAARRGVGLSRLLGSLAPTAHQDLETIVVEAPGDKPELDAGRPIVRVDAGPGPFNRARANNAGAREASGDYVLFLDEDMQMVDPDWIEQLLLHARLPGVSAVGPMLVRPDGLVDQAGVAIGLHEPASPMSPDIPADGDGYYGSLPCAHEVSAVSSACMLVPKDDFEAVGGFNEFYSSQYEDFDLCQRLARRGLRTVYAPRPRVVTHQTPTARRSATDIVDRALFVDCWYDELLRGDPYFNPGFGRQKANYAPAGWRERVYRATAPLGRR